MIVSIFAKGILPRPIENIMPAPWLYAGFPALVDNGFGERFEELARLHPPGSSDVSKWTGSDLLKMMEVLGLSQLEPALREQEFLPDNPEDESPFGSLDASELDEVFEDTSVSRIEIDALKVALRYLKGEFTNVSVKA